MSHDLYAGNQPCDHRIVLEPYHISFLDFRTLQYSQPPQASVNMRAPINGVSMTDVYIKGVLIPPSMYTLVVDTSTIQGQFTFYKIVLNAPNRMCDALVQVSYFTRQPFCRKCGGSGTVTDWVLSNSAGLENIYGAKKLAQQVLKYVLTSRNPFNPNLTCPIRGYLGKKWTAAIGTQDIITAVQTVLASYQQIQAAQQSVQTLTPHEMLKSVDSVQAVRDPDDPTMLYVTLGVSTYGSSDPVILNLALQTVVG